MRTIFATLLALASSVILPSADAFAGGVGIMTTGGFVASPVYYYDSAHNFAQYKQTQYLGTFGSGLEIVLGDRDNKIQGIFRGFWMMDLPETDPSKIAKAIPSGDVEANWRDKSRHIGAATFGVQWGYWGDPNSFMLTAVTSVGGGVLTTDHTEFFMAQVGPGVTYRIARPLEFFGEITYNVRLHKTTNHGMNGTVGLRYLFD